MGKRMTFYLTIAAVTIVTMIAVNKIPQLKALIEG